MTTDQANRRGTEGNRRKMKLWVMASWAGAAMLALVLSAGAGYTVANQAPSLEEITNTYPDNIPAIQTLADQIEVLTSREPETRVIVNTRLIRDTVEVMHVDTVYAPPEIYTMYDTTHSVRVDTFYMPPNIIRIPAPPRTFFSGDTYKPSIGNFSYALIGGLLGAWIHGQVDNSATSCIVINSEQTCEF